MYTKINKKLEIYKNASKIISFITRLLIVVIPVTILYLVQKNTSNDVLNENFVILNIIEKPKLQAYENDGDIISIIGDKAEVINNDIKIYNISIKSNILKSSAKIVDIINNGDKIILKNRPTMVFYNPK